MFPSTSNREEDIRRQIRRRYRQFQKDLEERRDELQNVGSTELKRRIEACDQFFSEVSETREAALDSKLIATLSHSAMKQAEGLSADMGDFSNTEFCNKFITWLESSGSYLTHSADLTPSGIASEGWEALGRSVAPYLNTTPRLQHMGGLCVVTPEKATPRKARTPKEKEKRVRAEKPEPVAPKQFECSSEMSEKLNAIHDMLVEECEGYDGQTCFFEVVVDPESFSQTIENLFYMSFLVRDRRVMLLLDADGLPAVKPVDPRAPRGQGKESCQSIVEMDMAQWKQIVRVFGVEYNSITRVLQKHSERTTREDEQHTQIVRVFGVEYSSITRVLQKHRDRTTKEDEQHTQEAQSKEVETEEEEEQGEPSGSRTQGAGKAAKAANTSTTDKDHVDTAAKDTTVKRSSKGAKTKSKGAKAKGTNKGAKTTCIGAKPPDKGAKNKEKGAKTTDTGAQSSDNSGKASTTSDKSTDQLDKVQEISGSYVQTSVKPETSSEETAQPSSSKTVETSAKSKVANKKATAPTSPQTSRGKGKGKATKGKRKKSLQKKGVVSEGYAESGDLDCIIID